MDFGIRSVPPCGDCDSDGHCTMNCGPAVPKEKFKFGDVIENKAASKDNPTRYGYFVREIKRSGRLNPGRYVEITDGNGSFWRSPLGGQDLVLFSNSSIEPI